MGTAFVVLLLGFFQAGRQSIRFQRSGLSVAAASATPSATVRKIISPLVAEDHKVRLENLASVSFGELYDLIHEASREQRASWAKQLEALPAGPRKLAAIDVFYKTMVQLDARTAIDLAL